MMTLISAMSVRWILIHEGIPLIVKDKTITIDLAIQL
jgi:hypothetical protein